MDTNFYELIEVPATASEDTIRQALTQKQRFWSKRSSNASSLEARQEAERKVAVLKEAQRILLDPQARQAYDAQRRGGSSVVPPAPAPQFPPPPQFPQQQSPQQPQYLPPPPQQGPVPPAPPQQSPSPPPVPPIWPQPPPPTARRSLTAAPRGLPEGLRKGIRFVPVVLAAWGAYLVIYWDLLKLGKPAGDRAGNTVFGVVLLIASLVWLMNRLVRR